MNTEPEFKEKSKQFDINSKVIFPTEKQTEGSMTERASKESSFREFEKEMRTEYGEEFAFTVIGFSKEKYQETTPFGVNYEKNVREFVKKFPGFAIKLKDDYEKGIGKPHKVLEKALAQNSYLTQEYKDKPIIITDLDLPEARRVYYDPDGYPNLQLDPTFYSFIKDKQDEGIYSKQEVLSLFSSTYPEKTSGYKVLLTNRDKWEQKGTKSEILAEIINEQGIETFSKTLECNGVPVETIIFKKDPTAEKMVRVYRGVVSADQTILRQMPYAARGKIEIRDSNQEQSHNYRTSVIQEVEGVEEDVARIAKSPSMSSILTYADKMRVYFKENNMSAELAHLEKSLIKFSQGVMEGYSLENMLSIEQVSGGMYTAQYLMAPYISATPNIGEAWTYGRGGVIVYDVPEAEIKNLSTSSECMISGILDEKYLSMFVFQNSRISDTSQIENALNAELTNPVYSREEINLVGERIHETRLNAEKDREPENKKVAIRILTESSAKKYSLANIDFTEFIPELEQINYQEPEIISQKYLEISNKINQKYIDFMISNSYLFEISSQRFEANLRGEGGNISTLIDRFFDRFENSKERLNERLDSYLPELKVDFAVVVQEAMKNKTSLNEEIYKQITHYCKNNQREVPKELIDIYERN